MDEDEEVEIGTMLRVISLSDDDVDDQGCPIAVGDIVELLEDDGCPSVPFHVKVVESDNDTIDSTWWMERENVEYYERLGNNEPADQTEKYEVGDIVMITHDYPPYFNKNDLVKLSRGDPYPPKGRAIIVTGREGDWAFSKSISILHRKGDQ